MSTIFLANISDIFYSPVMEQVDIIELIGSRRTAWKIEELAKILNCHKASLYEQVNEGKLPAVRIGGMLRLNPKTTANWLRDRQTVKV